MPVNTKGKKPAKHWRWKYRFAGKEKRLALGSYPDVSLAVARRERDMAARAVSAALILGASEASVLTPIDTGTLINSRYHSVSKDGTKIVGTTGYAAEYAAPVNDPDHPHHFRRPGATKDFLRNGFKRGAAEHRRRRAQDSQGLTPMTSRAPTNRVAAVEVRAEGEPGAGRLPVVLPVVQLDSEEARALGEGGYVVVSLEQCVEMMV